MKKTKSPGRNAFQNKAITNQYTTSSASPPNFRNTRAMLIYNRMGWGIRRKGTLADDHFVGRTGKSFCGPNMGMISTSHTIF